MPYNTENKFKLNNLIIDVATKDVYRLINALEKLATTKLVEDGGRYQEDKSYSQVHILTTKTESETEEWLYKSKRNFNYIGVSSVN